MDFKEWRKQWESDGMSDDDIEKFVEDGIINPDEWYRPENKEKILFVLKEPNGEQGEPALDGGTDLVASLRQDPDIKKYVTWRNINYWAYGLLHTHIDTPIPTWEEVRKTSERSLDKVAVINLKKMYGGSKVDNKQMKCFAIKDKELLLEQIEEINPDIIVTANNMYLLENIIGKENVGEIELGDFLDGTIKSKGWVNIWRREEKEVLIIRHYHPQATTMSGKSLKEEEKYRICCEIKQAYLRSMKQ